MAPEKWGRNGAMDNPIRWVIGILVVITVAIFRDKLRTIPDQVKDYFYKRRRDRYETARAIERLYKDLGGHYFDPILERFKIFRDYRSHIHRDIYQTCEKVVQKIEDQLKHNKAPSREEIRKEFLTVRKRILRYLKYGENGSKYSIFD